MSEWSEVKLRYLTTKIGSGATPTGGNSSYKSEGISLIRSQNVLDLSFSKDGLAFIDDKQAENLKNVAVLKGDVLLNITGDSVARVCKVPVGVLPARVNQHVAIIRVDSKKAKDDFLLYYLHFIKPHLLSISEIGGTRRALTKGMIENLEIEVPTLAEQKAIASILSSLDDKIDLLHRQNATLEKIAETLFRQWFVEEAKEEWEIGTLDDVLSVKGGTTPSTTVNEYWDGDIHWTSPRDITNLNGIFLFDTEKKITKLGLQKIGSGLLPKGTLLMSSRAPVGVLAFAEIPIAINQGYIAIIDDKGFSNEFIYLWLKENMETVQSYANGSTFLEISKSAFKTIEISKPPEEELANFQSEVKPLFDKIKTNQIQIRTLINLRDTLLPKLMSGEIRVES